MVRICFCQALRNWWSNLPGRAAFTDLLASVESRATRTELPGLRMATVVAQSPVRVDHPLVIAHRAPSAVFVLWLLGTT
jgi:hypothetical protein